MTAAKSQYKGEVREVYSGDDLVVMVDLGTEDLWKRQRIRLHGVDTPNGMAAAADTNAGKVRTYVRSLTKGRKVHIEVISRTANSWVAVVHVETHTGLHNLNEDLIAQGFKYTREKVHP